MLGWLCFKTKQSYLMLPAIIATSGLMVAGHAIVDEFFLLVLLVSYFSVEGNFAKFFHSIRQFHNTKFGALLLYFVFVFFTYFIIQSIRGWVFLDDHRMLRWVIFFLICPLFFIVLLSEAQHYDPKKYLRLIHMGCISSFLLYAVYGLLFENVFNMWRFDIQGFVWVGTSAMYPVMICYTISLLTIIKQDELSKRDSAMAIIGHIVVGFCAFFFESKSSQLVLFVSFLYSFVFYKNNSKVPVIGLTVVYLSLFALQAHIEKSVFFTKRPGQNISEKIGEYIPSGDTGIPNILTVPDQDRLLMPLAAWKSIVNNGVTLVFGHGWYTARYVIKKEMKLGREMQNRGSKQKIGDGPMQVNGIAGLLVDTGLFGLLLVVAGIVAISIQILLLTGYKGLIFISLYVLMIPGFFIGYGLASVLFWIMLMPSSSFVTMLRRL